MSALNSERAVIALLLSALGVLSSSCREDIELGLGQTASGPDDAPPIPAAPDASAPTPDDPPDSAPPDSAAPDAALPPEPEDCSASVPDGLIGARPAMGWNGYNAFECSTDLDEAVLRETADLLVSSGMQSAGYRYFILDDCWQERNEDGRREFLAERLPNGITSLVDYIDERGLSFGLFSLIEDCVQMPGSQGYELQDAEDFANWGVDYLKYTHCGMIDQDIEPPVVQMVEALALTQRPIIVSLAAPPFSPWMPRTVNLWRTADNAEPTWESMLASIDASLPLAAYARPGAFNDPDMLELGNGELTLGEQRAQFAVWSILAAPLIAGNDLRDMTDETLAILTNSGVIALNQDPLGLQAAVVQQQSDVDVLAKPLSDCGARGVVVFNRGSEEAEVSLIWPELWLQSQPASARDLWNDAEQEVDDEGLTLTVPGHDAVALRVDGTEPALPHGETYLGDLDWTYVTNGAQPGDVPIRSGVNQPLANGIRLNGAAYEYGLVTRVPSLIRYRLGQRCSRFVADVGLADEQDTASAAQFEIWADGQRLFQSGVVTASTPPVNVDIDLNGRRELRLMVGATDDATEPPERVVWAGALLYCQP